VIVTVGAAAGAELAAPHAEIVVAAAAIAIGMIFMEQSCTYS
jgi:hypothetical protein